MSRSNRTEGTRNPSKRWFKWNAKTQELKYWDKEKKENILVPFPFTFLFLDQLATVTGWHSQRDSEMWSNEVRNTRVEPFKVQTKQGEVITGVWDDVKNAVGRDAKFTWSIYIAFYDEDKELQLGNIKLYGKASQVWSDFTKSNKIYEGAITMSKGGKEKNKGVEFFVPAFKMKPDVSAETEEKAQELDKELQKYLSDYMADTFIDPTEMRLTQQVGAPRMHDLVKPWSGPGKTEDPIIHDGADHDDEEDYDDIPF